MLTYVVNNIVTHIAVVRKTRFTEQPDKASIIHKAQIIRTPRPTCLKISSSSLRRLSSNCRSPDSSASLILRSLSASIEYAWMRRSSSSRISSFVRKSSMSPSVSPSTALSSSSMRSSWQSLGRKQKKHELDIQRIVKRWPRGATSKH